MPSQSEGSFRVATGRVEKGDDSFHASVVKALLFSCHYVERWNRLADKCHWLEPQMPAKAFQLERLEILQLRGAHTCAYNQRNFRIHKSINRNAWIVSLHAVCIAPFNQTALMETAIICSLDGEDKWMCFSFSFFSFCSSKHCETTWHILVSQWAACNILNSCGES